MTNTSLAKLGLLVTFSVTSCSLFVNADRSEVKDDLYQPSDAGVTPDAAEPDAGDMEPTAGASGASGASGEEGGAAGAPEAAGASGAPEAAGAGGAPEAAAGAAGGG